MVRVRQPPADFATSALPNAPVIAEVIALNYLVKVYGGLSPAEKLNQHMLEVMKRKSAARAWVREDTE